MRRIRIFLALAGLMLAAAAHAQSIVLLTDPYVKKLSPEALKVYQEGVEAYDHVNYDLAVSKFYEAMKLDPQHVKLRFLVEDLAYRRARTKNGADATDLYNIAEEALNGLISRQDLKPEDLRRAQEALKAVKSDLDDLARRDVRREATGRQIIEEIATESEKPTSLPPLGIQSTNTAEAVGYGTATQGLTSVAGGARNAGTNPANRAQNANFNSSTNTSQNRGNTAQAGRSTARTSPNTRSRQFR
ncbi:MAG: hypothetical protein NTW86_22560 [Candidatus Sumerlaeota bacterium]|nr:hypothetical protein [Candidatus Sumerlaeota bacterium]